MNSYRLVLGYFIEYIKGAEADVVSESPDLQSYQDVYMYDKADKREIINYHSQNFRENLYYNTSDDNPWGNSPEEDGEAVIQSSDYGNKPKPKPPTITVNMTTLLKVPKEVLRLDPNTASPMLSVSKDGTSVKQGVLQTLPDTPERFIGLPCVLATKGISSGKHYWEVQILDDQCEGCNPSIWIIGAAKQSAKRKGKVYATADEGIWVLQWINFYQGGLSVPYDVMNAKTKPSILGLFLDYAMGSLTFYNAANGQVLYTITDKFSEPVFPLFCTTNSVELKV
ncbi:E3 ubiquitin-protein ligase TRIM39-like [Lissotriton helveticus]